MAEGRWADWQVRQIAENLAEKCPKRAWFEREPGLYYTSLKSWSHICARQLHSMKLEERQLIIFVHHPQDKGITSDFRPTEGQGNNK